jgi:PAS domain S-box-containing protein
MLEPKTPALEPGSPANSTVADPDRLRALEGYGILDTPAEEAFDDIVAIAAEVCDAPVALVSFVTSDRQWFKARVGFDATETPLDHSVCAHALEEREMLVIPDLSLDPRTRDNPLVTHDPAVRFYAGVVLVSPEGHPLGTLCVLDRTARPGGLSGGQSTALRSLGRHVMALLALRRAVATSNKAIAELAQAQREQSRVAESIKERELKLRLAVESAQIGIFDYDLETGRLDWDRRTRELFGLSPDDPVSYEASFLAGLHPDDREAADRAVQLALDPRGSGLFEHEHRTVAPDGRTLRWLSARGQAVFASGRAKRLVGMVRDVTARKQADEVVAATLERYTLVGRATNDAIWDWDLVSGHVLWNDALSTAYGYEWSDVEPTAQWLMDRIHPDDRQRAYDDIRMVVAGEADQWRREYRFRRANGQYADVFDRGNLIRDASGAPVRMIGAMLDLTERKEAEEQFRAVFEGANVGIVELDPRTVRAIRVNDKLCEIWGASREEILGHSLARWTPEEDAAPRDELHARLASGEPLRMLLEKRYRRADGRIIWARVNLVSRQLRDGVHCTAMIEDITAEREEKVRQEALVEIAARLRDLSDSRSIAEVACDTLGRVLAIDRASFGTVDASGSKVEIEVDWRREGLVSAVGVHALDRFGDLGETVAAGLVFAVDDVRTDPRTADHPKSYEALGIRSLLHVPILERGALVAMFFLHARQPQVWPPEAIAFVQAVADRTRAAVARARAEERQRLLNHELSHRMKNLLTMVQAIASQTMRTASSMDEAHKVLSGRLIALGKAHDVLLGGATTGSAALAALVTEALTPHVDQISRVAAAGPAVEVGSKAVLPLMLMLHELATNAAKYGALSQPGGRIAVSWDVSGPVGAETFRLAWVESGGPPVSPPTHQGFGTKLIERGLAGQLGAEVRLTYAAGGASCVLETPLARLQDGD